MAKQLKRTASELLTLVGAIVAPIMAVYMMVGILMILEMVSK